MNLEVLAFMSILCEYLNIFTLIKCKSLLSRPSVLFKIMGFRPSNIKTIKKTMVKKVKGRS